MTAQALNKLIREIQEAFAGVSRAGGVTIHEAEIIDYYGSSEERARARTLDTDARWEDVPAEVIEELCVFPFLDPIGLRYYLPAYMIWSLRNYSTSESLSVDAALNELCIYGEKIDGRQAERFSVFNQRQCQSIAHYLEYMAEHEAPYLAQRALDKYWNQFS